MEWRNIIVLVKMCRELCYPRDHVGQLESDRYGHCSWLDSGKMTKWSGGVAFKSEFKGKICCQSSIYERILGGIVGFDLENVHKLQVVAP